LAGITLFHISFYLLGYSWPQKIVGDQFYCLPLSPTSISWYSLMISVLSLSSLSTYTFSSLYIMPSTSHHSLSLSIFTPACFISSTVFTTSLSFTLDCFTFSSRSTSFMITSTPSVLYTSSYSGLTNILSLLSLSTPTSKSGLLLRLSAFLILLPGTCFSVKSNLDRYRVHLTCLLFNFYVFIKYSRSL